MKSIGPEIARKIEDFALESSVLPGYAIEKDFFVFDAIKLLSTLPANEDFRLVFCGGTCLSKAYGILDRMSEDVDFKIIPAIQSVNLAKSALRRKLSQYVESIVLALESGGFGAGNVARRSRDGNQYSALDIEFASVFPKPQSLRSHLLVELNHTTLATATEMRKIGILFDKMISAESPDTCEIECVSLVEALAEKLISFPRRLAMQLKKESGAAGLGEHWDNALVRHLYDVHQIIQKHPAIMKDTQEMVRLVSSVIEKDGADFANQHTAFVSDPNGEMWRALAWARGSNELKLQYSAFVMDMVYAAQADIPDFFAALDCFESALGLCLPLVK